MLIQGSKNEAINNAVFDFAYKGGKKIKNDKVFSVYVEENHDKICVTILGIHSPISLIIEENGTYNYRIFPTMLLETNGKLFFWYDETKNITDSVINVLHKYNFIDTISVYTFRMEIDDAKKGVDYYFCKNDLSKYKRVITNKAIGYYKPPRLRCK